MKLLSTVAAGALLLAGCAPFEHGHYESDTHFVNTVGDRPGTPVLIDSGPIDPYYEQATVAAVPAVYSAPIQVAAPAPVVHHHQPPIIHSVPAPAPIVQASYVEPVVQYAPPPPPPVHHIEYAPPVAPPPIAKPIRHYVEAAPIIEPPIVAASSVSVQEERYIGETRYAPPEVINAPPVFMRGPGQFSNRPFPAPALPNFGAPAYQQPPAQQPYGYPAPSAFTNPFAAPPLAANVRAPYPAGYNGGYNTPYGAGCVTTCVGSSSVF